MYFSTFYGRWKHESSLFYSNTVTMYSCNRKSAEKFPHTIALHDLDMMVSSAEPSLCLLVPSMYADIAMVNADDVAYRFWPMMRAI